VDFRHPWKSERKPQTFDFLGFTHYWGKPRSGGYAVTRQTKGKKFRAALANIAEWCKKHRHEPMAQQHRKLSEKVRGHMAYYGIRSTARLEEPDASIALVRVWGGYRRVTAGTTRKND